MSKPKYFLYTRKSTEDDNKQVMSIEAQLVELREFARRENLEIVREFQESKSAKTPGRPVFKKMMEQIEKEKSIGILAWHPDRLARNSVDGGKIIYLIDQETISSLCFPTFWFEPTPQGLFMLQVAFGQSKYYSDNLSQNTKRGMRQKLRRGEWLTKAPLGYVNNPKTRNIEPHPVYSKVIVKAFRKYTKGTHTYESLAEFLVQHNLTTRNGTPLGKASIKRMLTNRAYLGFVKYKDEWYEGSFEPILSSKLFEAVQDVLEDVEKPQGRKRKRHTFHFTGIFRCGECGSMITAQWATGKSGHRYRYYRCTKKNGACSQSYLQEGDLVEQVQEKLQTIALHDRYTDWMMKKVDVWEKEEGKESRSALHALSSKIKEQEERMEKLVDTYLEGDIPKSIYLKKKDKLLRFIHSLKEKQKEHEEGRKKWIEPLREWILDTKQADFLSSSADLEKISSFVKKVGTNPTVRDKSTRFAVPTPSDFVATKRPVLKSFAPVAHSSHALSAREVQFCDPQRGGLRTFDNLIDQLV
ncbi:MAG: recombinase family protein, partial [Candidatus Paceibacterota bacterium]